ncbi:hypothetical protein OIO90_002286 [Microbotryomycetes sp. JL221]|nr:hypothetical protein OIO90_002286 [Microbotryomycetes sp. JL221]
MLPTSSLKFGALAAFAAPVLVMGHKFAEFSQHRQIARAGGYQADSYNYGSNYGAGSDQAASSAWENQSYNAKSMSEWPAADGSSVKASDWQSKTPAAAKATEWTASGYGGGGSYEMCMQQCQVQCQGPSWQPPASESAAKAAPTEAPAAQWSSTYAPAAAPAPSAAPGGGVMPLMPGPNQVIVAPMKGDLRMVPFNIQVEVGTVIEFIWGAGPHTVTKSSLPNICQATKDTPFASGKQQAGFKWKYKVESNETISYFCGVEPHCSKGMFGLINGLVSLDANNTMDNWMKSYAKQNETFAAMWDTTQKTCSGTAAETWGAKLDVSQFPNWALPASAESILATRSALAVNATSSILPSASVSTNKPNESEMVTVSGSSGMTASSSGAVSTALPENGAASRTPAVVTMMAIVLFAISHAL